MKGSKFLIAVTGVLCFAFGTLFGGLLSLWFRISPFFFHVKLIEIIQLSVTILIAVTVSHFITAELLVI